MTQAQLTKQTKLKTSSIFNNSIAVIQDKKPILAIAHSQGLHLLSLPSFQNLYDIKLQDTTGNVTCLTISDQLIFFAKGMQICAAATNGKTIFSFQTFLAGDKINSIHVSGYRLWLSLDNLLIQFMLAGIQLMNKKSRLSPSPAEKTEDINSHSFDDKINATYLIEQQLSKPFLVILLNSNLICTFQKKQVVAKLKTQSPPTCLVPLPKKSDVISEQKLLIGTKRGQILCIKPTKDKITQLWKITENSINKINCFSLLKNGFIVFRDKEIQFWNEDRQMLGKEQTTEKVTSALFLSEVQGVVYGTQSGTVIFLCDYQRLLKQNAKRNEKVQRQKLQKQIGQLQAKKTQLLRQLEQSGKQVAKKIELKHNLSIDYTRYCYCLQITCDQTITKICIKTQANISDNQDILFKQKNNGWMNYVIRGQPSKIYRILLKSTQGFEGTFEDYKLSAIVYVQTFNHNGLCVLASPIDIDLKLLSLHHKVSSTYQNFGSNIYTSLLITGQFKHYQINMWLNSIFNDFGAAQGDAENYSQICYESIITKARLYIRYKAQYCQIRSLSFFPLYVIKKSIIQRSKQMGISLTYECQTSVKGLETQIKSIFPQLAKLHKLRQQYELIPGLLQLKSETISKDLQQILEKSQTIKTEFKQSQIRYEELQYQVISILKSYRSLNGKNTSQFQIEEMKKQINNAQNWESLIKIIVS